MAPTNPPINPAKWTVDANEALHVSLQRAAADKASLTPREHYEGFNPQFTYPLFGEDEKLYGYRDLRIDLKFASGSLAQFLSVRYSTKLPASSAVDDIKGTIDKFIPPGYYTDEAAFLARVEEDALTFRPPGTRIHSYTRSAKLPSKGKEKDPTVRILTPDGDGIIEYEVYRCTWDTPGFKELHRRMQLFILLYIEGGSYISEEEHAWQFVLLYEKRKRMSDPNVTTYHFIGYSTLYPFYYFPEKVRMRLSQFVILPPYQQEGHGSALYSAIYRHVFESPEIAELTVEDPVEAFEDLRDRNDLKMLFKNERFMREALEEGWNEGQGTTGGVARMAARAKGHRYHPYARHRDNGCEAKAEAAKPNTNDDGLLSPPPEDGGEDSQENIPLRLLTRGKLGPPADRSWLEHWRVDLKMASRQFHRLVEMLMLQFVVVEGCDKRLEKAYRVWVKERLFRFNYEVLAQLDKKERQAKLDETFRNVRKDYERILAMVH